MLSNRMMKPPDSTAPGAQSGTLWVWGYNQFGKLGLGDTANRSSPVQVGSGTDWAFVCMGQIHAAAIKTDGTLWTWGYNGQGQLGLGDTTNRSSPVQVGSLSDWSRVSVNGQVTSAVKTDGTMWNWGAGYRWGSGFIDMDNRSSPEQIGSDMDWRMSNVSVGYFGQATKTDGTLWSWGSNFYEYESGRSGGGFPKSPMQVGNLTTWVQSQNVEYWHVLVTKTDGTLWGWGKNGEYQLGLGDTTNRSSPVQVGSLSDWNMAVGAWAQSAAIKTDGTLWTWGTNNGGVLGLGDTTNRSSPVQVGSLSDWSQIHMGGTYSSNTNACVAIKTNGTLWAWGGGTAGVLGLGDTSNRSSPVQVGSLSDWCMVSVGETCCAAIRAV